MDDILKAVSNMFDGIDIIESDGIPISQSHSNILGGMDTFHNGQLVDHSVPNIFGGLDHHDPSGQISHSTHPNIFGGVDVTDTMGHVVAHTQPNIFGGVNIFDSQNYLEGQIIPDPTGFHAKFFK